LEEELVIYYDYMSSSPVGSLLLGVSKKGLCAVILGRGSLETKKKTLRRMFPRVDVQRNSSKVKRYRREIRDYLQGKRQKISIPIDLQAVKSPFQRRVLNHCRRIPFGRTVSYGRLALRVGAPAAARAVGGAMAANPVPIVVPCHRVVASNGGLQGYSGGLHYKKKLLAIEGLAVKGKKLMSIPRP
jgi:O-6-methylguanine DNA methyltransferase